MAAALHFAFFVAILWGKIKNLCNEKRSMNSKVPRNICKVTGESRRRRGVTTYISQVATYVKVSKSQKIFLFSFHLQKRKININLQQVILWKTTLYLIFSNTYTYVFANGNDNPIFKPKPKNHSVDNNMFQVHRKFFNLKFWKEWVKTKDSFWDLAFFMQSMLHFQAWAVTKFWHLCQLRAAAL